MALAARIQASGGTVRLTLASLTFLIALVLLPDLGPTVTGPAAVDAWHGRVTAILDPHRPDPTGAGGGFLPDARVLLLDGPRAGEEVEAYRQGPGGQQDGNAYRVGEDVVVSSTASPDRGPFLAIEDRWRLPQLLALSALFAAAVIVVGGWRGVRALLGLALTIAILLKVLVPLLVAGVPPIPVAVVVATVLTIIAIGLTEGPSRASVAAILGTAGALALAAILAAVVTAAAGFTNTLGSELVGLTLPNGAGLDLRGILLAAFMVGAIGVLDDVTVTQAIAVDELARAGVRGPELFRSAFGIGRSHVAATVNTLFLAYAGAALPLLILLVVGHQPVALLLNGEAIAIEIVRTMVGSLGIVAAVPLTTVIAAWLANAAAIDPAGDRRRRGAPSVALTFVGGLVAIALAALAAGAILGPLTTGGQHAPLSPESFGGPIPSASGPTASSSGPTSSGPTGSAPTGPGLEDGPIFAVGDSIPLFSAAGSEIGTVEVLTVDPVPSTDGAGLVLDVELRFRASHPLAIESGAWVVRTSDDDRVPGTRPTDPSAHPALPSSLRAGQTATGWLSFRPAGTPAAAWLDYVQSGTSLFAVPLY
jgi:uncharacterized membrane protein